MQIIFREAVLKDSDIDESDDKDALEINIDETGTAAFYEDSLQLQYYFLL